MQVNDTRHFASFGRWMLVPSILALCVARSRSGAVALAAGCRWDGAKVVALTTLAAGAVALGLVNIFLLWLESSTPIRLDFGPYTYVSLSNALRVFVLVPVYWVLLVGGWIAAIFGIVYGAVLYVRAAP